MTKQDTTIDATAHTPGTSRGEEKVKDEGKEPGRQDNDETDGGRTARDSTGINAENMEPVDPRMPNMPPA